MRNLIFLATLLFIVSCTRDPYDKPIDSKSVEAEKELIPSHYNFYIKEIDSCEYIIFRGEYAPSIIHKANCKNHKYENN